MRKGVVLISAFLTAFTLAMLAGVVAAYKTTADSQAAGQQISQSNAATDPSTVDPVALQAATPTQVISPQDAAALAAKFLNQKDLYSVEIVMYNGANTYKVTFSSGDILYVSLNGQVVSLTKAPTSTPQVVIVQSQSYSSGRHSGGGGGGGGGGEAGDN